jgi:hypothetical protein
MQKTRTKKKYSAKTVATISQLSELRQWLRINCKSRWTATNFKGDSFNWRALAKTDFALYNMMGMHITIIVHFNKPEDLMLYMLSWPSEVLLSD